MPLHVLHLPSVRVSCSSFARIRDGQGRLLLLINKHRLSKGARVLSPIGGALEATDEGLRHLKRAFDLADDAFESPPNLRFPLPGGEMNRYREWFLRREQRETSVLRETVEELADEYRLGERLALEGLTSVFRGYIGYLYAAKRAGQEGRQSLQLAEVHDVALSAATLSRILAAAARPDALCAFVTQEELAQGRTVDGKEIADVAAMLSSPSPTIDPFL